MRRAGPASLILMSAAILVGCASNGVFAAQGPAASPAWTGNVVAALGMLYPPAQTRLYVVEAPTGVPDLLRHAGFGVVDGRVAGPAPRDGLRLVIQTRDLGDGTIAVIAHVGQQTLSRVYANGHGASGWSFDLTGATTAMKERVALIQYPPPRVVLPASPTSEAAHR